MILASHKNNDLRTKIEVICSVQFGGCSDTEINLLEALLEHRQGNRVTITPILSESIRNDLNLKTSTFSTCISRLEEKKVISRGGKVVNFHLIFKDIDKLEGLLVKFSPQV